MVHKFEPRERGGDGGQAADKLRRGLAGARDVTAKATGAEGGKGQKDKGGGGD